jgi:hypothetical protein
MLVVGHLKFVMETYIGIVTLTSQIRAAAILLLLNVENYDTHGSVHRRLLSRNTNRMQLCNRIYYSKVL